MLNSTSLPLRQWQKTSAVMVMTLAIFFSALISTADDVTRIATLTTPGPIPSERPFDGPETRPWEPIGPSDSYLRVDVAALKSHPDVDQWLAEYGRVIIDENDHVDGGQFARSMQTFQSDFHMATKRLPQPTDNGHQWAVIQSIDRFDIEFDSLIDWSAVANAFNWQWAGPTTDPGISRLREKVSAIGHSDVLVPREGTTIDQVRQRLDTLRSYGLKALMAKPDATKADGQSLRDAKIEIETLGDERTTVVVMTCSGVTAELLAI